MLRDRKFAGQLLILTALSLVGMSLSWWAAGASLGLFVGGLSVITFLAPAAVLEREPPIHSLVAFIYTIIPIAIFWLVAAGATPDTLPQCVAAVVVLASYGLAVSGLALALSRAELPPIFSAAVAIVVSLAWLTWPIWLPANAGPGLDAFIQHLVAYHPGLVINGILTAEPAWTERTVAYQLTNLNQDISIVLPSTILPCVLVHGACGACLWAIAFVRKRSVAAG